MRKYVIATCCVAALLGCSGDSGPADSFGHFEGDVIGVWDPNGRDMTLREGFAYIDRTQKRWHAPSGSVVNGASIPRAFWSITGGPFEGQYRSASVVHDVACVEMTETWQDVHRMFYEACRCGGVGERKAKTLYWAVYNFGPRWEFVEQTVPETGETVRVSQPIAPPPVPENIETIAEEFFETTEVNVDAIESLTVEEIQEAVPEVDLTQDDDFAGPEETGSAGDHDATDIEQAGHSDDGTPAEPADERHEGDDAGTYEEQLQLDENSSPLDDSAIEPIRE